MKRILELFEELNKRKRGSGDTIEAFNFLRDFCANAGAKVTTDKAGNILASIQTPKICLQSHYDLVALGDQPPSIVKDGEWLRAKNGTLGADNGIGVAIMLRLIEERVAGEYLFTNDEEIGLIGANNLSVIPTSKEIINLDSEDEGEIIIGCAGGADYLLTIPFSYEPIDAKRFCAYKIAAKNCDGGHSGVDIHRGIKSAIDEVCRYLFENEAKLVSFNGGERLNSIPKNAEAIAFLPIDFSPKDSESIRIFPIDAPPQAIKDNRKVLALLTLIPHGVYGFDSSYGVVSRSCNFAIINTLSDRLDLTLFARGNGEYDLKAIDAQITALSKLGDFNFTRLGYYPSWSAEKTPLADRILSLMSDQGLKPKIGAIHAGLECGILKSKSPNAECVSIGMTIRYPHSFQERVYLPSVERLYSLIKAVLSS
ncbi:MAG: hypothetical protein LBP89_02050 [Helicobacteraceae bacterium]|jgi:dipeptidase D|nr:hypothetical protein [Helicobacteraceae bacterium]